MRRALALSLLAILAFGCADVEVARVERAGRVLIEVRVDIAQTAEARRSGLRGRSALPADQGLWIAFPVEDEVCIVNEGVPFAIDAVFIGAEGEVTAVERFDAGAPDARCHQAMDVLEVSAGLAAEVRPGDMALRVGS